MGIYVIRSKRTGRTFIEYASDLKSAVNSSLFKLRAGMHPNRSLQADWNAQGAESFSIEILDRLEYAKDPSKADYAGELAELRSIWIERLAAENVELY